MPGSEIEAIFNTAAGNEIVTGKFDSPESSAAIAANAFGFFLQRASDLPALPGCGSETWPALSLMLEAELRFPWSGGRHPVLDCLVRTPSALIGIESKRLEPYRTRHTSPLSDAYWRRVWGEHMSGYERVRDSLTRAIIYLRYPTRGNYNVLPNPGGRRGETQHEQHLLVWRATPRGLPARTVSFGEVGKYSFSVP